MSAALTILFDGLAYGGVLFILSVGLVVTLGLMNVVNLAHGAFAMLGGYVAAIGVGRLGLPYLAVLPLAFAVAALAGLAAERMLYRHIYRRSHLDQVLFSVALLFMATAGADYLSGAQGQMITLPVWLQGRFDMLPAGLAEVGIGRYRAFVLAVGVVIAAALQAVLTHSRWGARLRAAVDDGRTARGLGIDTGAIMAAAFAVGSGLAGLGGALAVEVMGLDPGFALRIMVYVLIVVAVGGTTGLKGPFLAAMILGVADVAGKYYLPQIGAFLIYLVMITALVARPHGLLAPARSDAMR